MTRSARSPNVLGVVTDRSRAEHVGVMGNQAVHTPVLDARADRGTLIAPMVT